MKNIILFLIFFSILIFLFIFNKFLIEKFMNDDTIPKIIWLYWNDENYSKIVKYCINLIKKLNPNYKINILNRKNFKVFIKSPKVIKLLNSNIANNHKSDIVRLYLLNIYGGIYIDITSLVFKNFDWIYDKKINLILSKIDKYSDSNNTTIDSWFIACKKGNKFIKKSYELFLELLDLNLNNKPIFNIKFNKIKNYIKDNLWVKNNVSPEYHIIYYVFIYIYKKYNIKNIKNIKYINNKNNDIFPCICNKYECEHISVNDMFNKKIKKNNYNFIKLTGITRKGIEKKFEDISEGSIMSYLNNIIKF